VPEPVQERPSKKERPVRQMLHKEQGRDMKVEECILALGLGLNRKQSGEEQPERKLAGAQLEHKTVHELKHRTVQELMRKMVEERMKAVEERMIAEKELVRRMVEERKTVGVESRLAEELGDKPVGAGKPK
jgi:biotin-(acetyl-CoA carboxylase) ligase